MQAHVQINIILQFHDKLRKGLHGNRLSSFVSKSHQRIIEKLNVSNTAGAIQYALNIGII
ncbi:MAG: hypothetical protein PHI28_03820 [Mangrovibacterium sp.]|nr:hypothetical protein [Mangrovibacterium sp.]